MQKVARLLAIEKIIEEENISSQEELIRKLKGEGISCTQATLSRNLRQMGIIRIPDGKGGYKYTMPGAIRQQRDTDSMFNIITVIKQIIDANSMVIMKTNPGHANSVAVLIDDAERFEIAGTIAGDDTLLIIPRDNISLTHLHDSLELILPGLHNQVRRE
jgi:transcriptional regulator of arginine metabolism